MVGQHRTLADIKEAMSPEELWSRVVGPVSDACTKALISLEMVADVRVSEALMVKPGQVVPDYEPGFGAIKGLLCNKPRRGHTKLSYRDLVLLPKEGKLAPFTDAFLSYVESLPPTQELIFPFCRRTALNKVVVATGLWNHYFRSRAHDYWVSVFKDAQTAGIYLNVDERSLKPYRHVDLDAFKGSILA
jgi:hypothetical protein